MVVGDYRGGDGQGGIRTHDTLTGIPVFEANTAKAISFARGDGVSEFHLRPLIRERETSWLVRATLT